jgi:REP element-mobilizing transposase RayT
VTARGVDRGLIVRDEVDREALHRIVLLTERRFSWRYDAYCLMSSHFHVVVRTPLPSLSKGMHWLNGVYAQRFNRRHGGLAVVGREVSSALPADHSGRGLGTVPRAWLGRPGS